MEISEVIDFLEDNGISEIKDLKSQEECSVLNCYYDFDKDEIAAARAYANEESDVEEESDEWYRDWYLSYLGDIAKDNIEEILENLDEELAVTSMFKILVDNENSGEYVKFIAVICDENFDVDLEGILNDYL